MSKYNQRIDNAVAGDLGTTIAPRTATLKEIIKYSSQIDYFILAYIENDLVCYDRMTINRVVNGMRIKVPRFQSHPVIEDRLNKQFYKRYYVVANGLLFLLKVKRTTEFNERLPISINDQMPVNTTIIIDAEPMWLRKRSLLFNRQRESYVPHAKSVTTRDAMA